MVGGGVSGGGDHSYGMNDGRGGHVKATYWTIARGS